MARAKNLRRKRAVLAPAARVVIVTEGALTEPKYLRSFNLIHTDNATRLVIRSGIGDPRAVVERAVREKKALRGDSLAGQDTVWAVFDRDIHPRFAQAIDLARANGIQLAVSDPCFEIWGVFHYRDFDAPVDRHACQRELASHCSSYSNSGSKVFDDSVAIQNGYKDAVARAKNSRRRRQEEGHPEGNPSTRVYLLTEHILKLFALQQFAGR